MTDWIQLKNYTANLRSQQHETQQTINQLLLVIENKRLVQVSYSQRGPGVPPVVHLEFLAVNRELHKS